MKRKLLMLCALACWGWTAAGAQNYNELVEQAMDYTLKDSLRQAEHLYREALKLDPNNARNALLFSNLGTVLHRQGRTDEAIEAYTMGLNIIPYSTAMLLNRAALYMEENLLDKAYVDYCNVIDLLPEEKEARSMRAYIYMGRRQYREARIDYNVVLRLDAKDKTARVGMALLDEKENRLAAATGQLDALINEYPGDVSLLKMRANLWLGRGQLDVALLDLESAARLDATDPDTYLMLGDTYLKLGKKQEARTAYEQAIARGIPRPQLASQLKMCR